MNSLPVDSPSVSPPVAPLAPLWLALSVQWDGCSVALATADGPIDIRYAEPGSVSPAVGLPAPLASREALPLVARLLAAHDRRLADVSALCFARGPGAFTALRVAAGLVQGLGRASGRPVAAICSLAALAAAAPAWSGAGGRGDWLHLAALDARMGEVYYGVQRCTAGRHPRTLVAPAVGSAAAALACFAAEVEQSAGLPVVCSGNGFVVLPELARWADGRGRGPTGTPDAAAVLALARCIDAPPAGPPALARPVYIREKIALDIGEQRALRAANVGADGLAAAGRGP